MLCPTCKTPLSIADRQGVEIDYCPTCRGVWLDRGELDKILERSVTPAAHPSATSSAVGGHLSPPPPPYGYRRHDDDDDDDRRRYVHPGDGQPGYDPRYGQTGYPRRRRESWLSDLFDFD